MKAATQIQTRLLPTQKAVLTFITRFRQANKDQVPTFREIAEAENFADANTSRYHVKQLADKGFLHAKTAEDILLRSRKDGKVRQVETRRYQRKSPHPKPKFDLVALLLSDDHAIERLGKLFGNRASR